MLDAALDGACTVREETQHTVIFAEHVRAEAGEAPLGAPAKHLAEEHGAEPLALIAILEEKV